MVAENTVFVSGMHMTFENFHVACVMYGLARNMIDLSEWNWYYRPSQDVIDDLEDMVIAGVAYGWPRPDEHRIKQIIEVMKYKRFDFQGSDNGQAEVCN